MNVKIDVVVGLYNMGNKYLNRDLGKKSLTEFIALGGH